MSDLKLTPEIVSRFLETKLGISNWRSKLAANQLEFLKEVVAAHECQVYYQNVSWSAVSPADRKIPTISEVIYHGSETSGGTCIHLNYFIKLILEHLGYDAVIVGAESPGWAVGKCHMVTVVRFPKTRQNYLIDLGFGRPFLEPVPLHNLPFLGRAGGFSFEYRFNTETQNYERFAKTGCPIKGKFEPDFPGKVYYTFKLDPLTFEDFNECLTDIFTPSVNSPGLLDSLLLHRLIRMESPKSFDYICFRNVVMIQGSCDTYKETVYQCYEEMLAEIQKYFPHLDWTELTKAFRNFEQERKAKEAAKHGA